MMRYARALHCRIGAGGEALKPWRAVPMGLTGNGGSSRTRPAAVRSRIQAVCQSTRCPCRSPNRHRALSETPTGALSERGFQGCSLRVCPRPSQRQDPMGYHISRLRGLLLGRTGTNNRPTLGPRVHCTASANPLDSSVSPLQLCVYLSFPTRIHAKQGSSGGGNQIVVCPPASMNCLYYMSGPR